MWCSKLIFIFIRNLETCVLKTAHLMQSNISNELQPGTTSACRVVHYTPTGILQKILPRHNGVTVVEKYWRKEINSFLEKFSVPLLLSYLSEANNSNILEENSTDCTFRPKFQVCLSPPAGIST